MILSRSWGYAVRALTQMAEKYDDESFRWQAAELAEVAGLSQSFLPKVLQQLKSAGLVESTRGRGGGVKLAKSPEEITLLDIAKATEDKLNFNMATAGLEDAPEYLRNELIKRWRPYKTGTIEFLSETTIDNLTE